MNRTQPSRAHTFFRLLAYLFQHYKLQLIVVVICVIIGSIASVIATMFLQRLIDNCITPGITQGLDAVWSDFISIIITMGAIYILGVLASFLYTRIMAAVTQGTLMHLRDDMFNHMQSLPIRYFDTHVHGDIMSTYTNDTDAIRQLIGQSIPTLIQSGLTFIAIFLMMLYYSVWLTIAVCAFIFIMLMMTKKLAGASAFHMVDQQKSLAEEEGYIEESIEGQRVIKVFCHEEESKKRFLEINEELFHNSEKANQYGNILMPILANIGNLMYVILAVIGGAACFISVRQTSVSPASVPSQSVSLSRSWACPVNCRRPLVRLLCKPL